ncbi:MAG TPA: putative zinc-binding metallopeptidase [Polyangiaceae bacterium]|nr:putative zinc-binding metallopeptidase [Polyangiaceae bacterium]
MKIFTCSSCEQLVFFENVRCTKCGATLAFLPDLGVVSAIVPDAEFFKSTLPAAKDARYRLCRNSLEHGVCNWVVPAEEDAAYCRSCRLNDVIPNLAQPEALVAWGRIEQAKRRLLFTLFQLGLPVESGQEKPGGLVFSFKAAEAGDGAPVLTGHDNGHITLNVAEADNPGRERLREQLGETYRTLLGHFRHEVGHYYFDALIRDTQELPAFRELFGDPERSYEAELKRHYAEGPPPSWQDSFVSAYATMHPWEDWAETWAHYLHMVDTLDTGRSYGIALRPQPLGALGPRGDLRLRSTQLDFDDFDDLINGWLPLTFALNSLNRSMGLPDCYPFVLSAPAIAKLRFVHEVIERATG